MQSSRIPSFGGHPGMMYPVVPVCPVRGQWTVQQSTPRHSPACVLPGVTTGRPQQMTWTYQPSPITGGNKKILQGVISSPALSHTSSDSGITSRSPSPASSTDITLCTPEQSPAATTNQYYKYAASPVLASSKTGLYPRYASGDKISPPKPTGKGLKRKLSVCSENDSTGEDSARDNDDSLLSEPKPKKFMRPWEDMNNNSVMQGIQKSKENVDYRKEGMDTKSRRDFKVKEDKVVERDTKCRRDLKIKEEVSTTTSSGTTSIVVPSPQDGVQSSQQQHQQTSKITPGNKASSTLSSMETSLPEIVTMTQQYQHNVMMSQRLQTHPKVYTPGYPYVSVYMPQFGLTSRSYQQHQYNAAAVQAAASFGHGIHQTTPQFHSGSFSHMNSNTAVGLPSAQDTEDFLTKGRLNPMATKVLTDWYRKNSSDPYPSNVEAKKIAQEGGISMAQVRKWMANKRVRSCNTVKVNKSLKCKQGIKQTDEGDS